MLNTIINAVIAWLSVRNEEEVPLWAMGSTSTGTDTLGTLFMLPLITTLLVTTVVWRELREGGLERLRGLGRRLPILAALPPSRILRGLALGVLTFVLLSVPVTLLLVLSGLGDLSRDEFIAFKTAFAVGLGALVTPVIALRAMADRPP